MELLTKEKIIATIQDIIDNDVVLQTNSDIVKVSWSGGKDSTASVLLHTALGHKCKIVCYIPMLTNTIPLILKNHYAFILETADKFKSLGHDVSIITGKNYCRIFNERITRGKNTDKKRGYSLGFGFCVFRDLSKIKSLTTYDVGFYDYEDIGIAFDEVKRQHQLNINKRSILTELKVSEKHAKDICFRLHVLSPHYDTSTRDGCAICPNASINELDLYIKDYPHAKKILMQLDKKYNDLYNKGEIKDNNGEKIYPYRNHKNFTDRMKGDLK